MTAYRFRVKFASDPTSLWRDIVIGADRTVADFQAAINPAVGLDNDHLWFIGDGEEYWDSPIKYQSSDEYEQSLGGDPVLQTERIENAAAVSIGEMTRQLGLEQYDRICYLYDYGSEWRFYAILKEIISGEPSDRGVEVVKENGEPLDPHQQSATSVDADQPLPAPLYSVLPETAVPVADLRELEARDDISYVLPLLSLETGFGPVCERFGIQYEEAGYVLENYKPGWEVVKEVPGSTKGEEELLSDLATAVREWHAEIAEISGTMTGQHFDEETVEAMHVELNAELERRGYGHL